MPQDLSALFVIWRAGTVNLGRRKNSNGHYRSNFIVQCWRGSVKAPLNGELCLLSLPEEMFIAMSMPRGRVLRLGAAGLAGLLVLRLFACPGRPVCFVSRLPRRSLGLLREFRAVLGLLRIVLGFAVGAWFCSWLLLGW